MSVTRKKKKFSNNQPVAFRFSDRKMIGTVVQVKPIGKKFFYDVLAENGIVYEDLEVDVEMNHCIDTYLTKLFYKKYDISENSIPETDHTFPESYIQSIESNNSSTDQNDIVEYTDRLLDKEFFYDEDELDPNY
jgi:hypothetical protein